MGRFSIIDKPIYFPLYLTAECVPVEGTNMATKQVTTHTDTARFYECTTKESPTGGYIPNSPNLQCEYEIVDSSLWDVRQCPMTATSKDQCTQLTGKVSTALGTSTRKIYSIPVNTKIYIDTDKVFGDALLFVRYPAYGLQVRQADGYLQETTNNCLLNKVGVTVHPIDLSVENEIKPGIPYNVVAASVLGKTNQYVSLAGIEKGAPIYISRPGYYFKISVAQDGFEYIDTRVEYNNPAIECIPRTTGCSDEAKVIKLAEQKCSATSGTPVGYAPVQGDLDTLCKYQCNSGTVTKTNDCIEIPTTPCPEGSNYNTASHQCESLSGKVVTPEKTQMSGMLVLLFIIFAVIGALIGWKITDMTGVENKWVKAGIIIGCAIVIGLFFVLLIKGFISGLKNMLSW